MDGVELKVILKVNIKVKIKFTNEFRENAKGKVIAMIIFSVKVVFKVK